MIKYDSPNSTDSCYFSMSFCYTVLTCSEAVMSVNMDISSTYLHSAWKYYCFILTWQRAYFISFPRQQGLKVATAGPRPDSWTKVINLSTEYLFLFKWRQMWEIRYGKKNKKQKSFYVSVFRHQGRWQIWPALDKAPPPMCTKNVMKTNSRHPLTYWAQYNTPICLPQSAGLSITHKTDWSNRALSRTAIS